MNSLLLLLHLLNLRLAEGPLCLSFALIKLLLLLYLRLLLTRLSQLQMNSLLLSSFMLNTLLLLLKTFNSCCFGKFC